MCATRLWLSEHDKSVHWLSGRHAIAGELGGVECTKTVPDEDDMIANKIVNYRLDLLNPQTSTWMDRPQNSVVHGRGKIQEIQHPIDGSHRATEVYVVDAVNPLDGSVGTVHGK